MTQITQLPAPAAGTISQRALAVMRDRNAAGIKDELSAGISTGFGVLKYRGKVWRIAFGGEETDLTREVEGQTEPTPHVEVVIVRAAGAISKNWYEKGFTEGSNEAPDCFSTNGITPDVASAKKQNPICASCKWNQFGSRVSNDGVGKGKACGDSKRLVIVPPADIQNESLGGPMLVRIPAASLGELARYADLMHRNGWPYWSVATRLYFDTKEAYPKILLKGVRVLTDEEFIQIEVLRDDPRTLRILETAAEHTDKAPEAPAPTEALFEQPPTGVPAPDAAQQAAQQQAAAQEAAKQQQAAAEAQARANAEAEARAKAEAEAKAKADAEAKAQQTAQASNSGNGFGAAFGGGAPKQDAPQTAQEPAGAASNVPAGATQPASTTAAGGASEATQQPPANWDDMLDAMLA